MQTFLDLDPASGEPIAEYPIATSAEVHAAAEAAREAQQAWGALEAAARLDVMRGMIPQLEQRADELADTITTEMGKTRRSALVEVRAQIAELPIVLGEIERALEPQHFQAGSSHTEVLREPLGVVAAITPWNFPIGMPCSILVPALGMGNGVVFKPSELVPKTGAILAEAFSESLPAGLLQVLQGPGSVGAELTRAAVDMVGFVGSRATGERIMAVCADGLKRLVLELGGKDPLVVFADADLEAAADCAVQHSLRNTGQVCCSVERVFVADAVAAEFEQLVLQRAQSWTHGSGFDAGSRMGPMVSETQRRLVHEQVQDAVAGGARLLQGGELPSGKGYFYPATVLADVTADHRIQREETFGPVVSLTRFSGREEDAVQLANDTPYGLGANIWSRDLERASRVARRVRAGQVGVNRYLGGAPGTPWVGARQSGFGFLGGVEGHRQFSTPKTICTAR